jgi:hypothetical protein
MRRILVILFMSVCLSITASASLWAQATAQISGTVRDQSGAVLPGVELTAMQTETGISRTTISNETGSYVMPNLPLGPYRLEAGLPGFRTFVQTGIVLQVNSSPVINVVLEVGQVTEQVEVQANANLVETRSQGVGQVIENARILELPLNGRNVTDWDRQPGIIATVSYNRTARAGVSSRCVSRYQQFCVGSAYHRISGHGDDSVVCKFEQQSIRTNSGGATDPQDSICVEIYVLRGK